MPVQLLHRSRQQEAKDCATGRVRVGVRFRGGQAIEIETGSDLVCASQIETTCCNRAAMHEATDTSWFEQSFKKETQSF